MYDSLLVPTDGSETVDRTLDHAIRLASDHDATVHALSVVDTRIVRAATDATREEIETDLERECEAAVDAVRDRARAADLDAVGEVRRGTPDKAILEYAAEIDADLIAIGTHGKSPREKQRTMGSVSERVVDDAETTVLVVRDAPAPE